jgi:hypothetical protein
LETVGICVSTWMVRTVLRMPVLRMTGLGKDRSDHGKGGLADVVDTKQLNDYSQLRVLINAMRNCSAYLHLYTLVLAEWLS